MRKEENSDGPKDAEALWKVENDRQRGVEMELRS